MPGFHEELLESEDFSQYSLRATFFVSRLRKMRLWHAIDHVNALHAECFTWDHRSEWGVEEDGWERIQSKGIAPLQYFCHPRLITEQPWLLIYYRNVAMISQKGLGKIIGGNIARIESGEVDELNSEWVEKLVLTLNGILSAIVETAADLDARDLPGFQFASAGATIQGSWNNAIGSAGEVAVRTILVNHLRAEIQQIVWRDQTQSDYDANLHSSLIDRIDDVRLVRMTGGVAAGVCQRAGRFASRR